MRQAGTITAQSDAKRFANYLLTLGITSKVEPTADAWAIWVHNENDMQRSRVELQKFLSTPADPRYEDAEREAETVRKAAAEKARLAQKNYVDMRTAWSNPWRRRRVTWGMIAACVLLAISDLPTTGLLFSQQLIFEGQIWRLITPIFIHGSTWHLLFNMFMLYQFGTMIEWALGWWRYTVLIVAIAIVSNLGQFLWLNEHFIGMSGVVYGLFGYAWLRSRLDPTCGLHIRSDLVAMMIGWLLLCMTPAVTHVANGARVVGLACGAAIGAVQGYWRRSR